MGNPVEVAQFRRLLDRRLTEVQEEHKKYKALKGMRQQLYRTLNSNDAMNEFFEVGSVPDIEEFNGKFSTLSISPGYYTRIEPKEFGSAVVFGRKVIDDKKYPVFMNTGSELLDSADRKMEKYAVKPFAYATSIAFDFITNQEEGKPLASTTHTTKSGASTTSGFSNAGTSAMSKTSVAATRLLMKKFRTPLGERMDVDDNELGLIFPDALAETAHEINFTIKGLDTVEGNANFHYQRYKLTPYPRLDDYSSTSWGMLNLPLMKKDLVWISRISPEIKSHVDEWTLQTMISVYTRFGLGHLGWRWIYWHTVT